MHSTFDNYACSYNANCVQITHTIYEVIYFTVAVQTLKMIRKLIQNYKLNLL